MKYKNIEIKNLKLDLENPRLPKSKQNKDENTVIEFMLLETVALELMMSIGQNDYFAGEPLLIVEDESDKGKYVVVEGNRRLTSLKLLNDPSITLVKKENVKIISSEAIFKPSEVPCLIFEKKELILNYLGFRHITGTKTWRLLEKARYLFELKEREFRGVNFSDTCKYIAKMIGCRINYAKKLLIAYSLYNKIADEGFYGIENLSATRFHLNYFVDALLMDNIRNFIGVNINEYLEDQKLNLDNLRLLTHWWFEKTGSKSRVTGNSAGLKMLDAVIGNPVALKAFRDDGRNIYDAYELTYDIGLAFENGISKALKSLMNADLYSIKIGNFHSSTIEDLKTIGEIALKIRYYHFQKNKMKMPDEF